MTWYSQAGQDRWVDTMTGGRLGGFFVDLGAYDGVQTSNTLGLVEERGWSGLCVEANPDYYDALVRNRPESFLVHAAVAGSIGLLHWAHQQATADLLAPTVPAKTLGQLLDEANAPERVDYLSIDVEGMEFEVFEAYDFSRRVDLLTVEHNLYCDGPANKNRLHALLTSRGFIRVVEDAPCLDPNPLYYLQPYEDWYANAAFLAS